MVLMKMQRCPHDPHDTPRFPRNLEGQRDDTSPVGRKDARKSPRHRAKVGRGQIPGAGDGIVIDGTD